MHVYPPKRANWPENCFACGSRKETVLIKFYESGNDKSLFLCQDCYDALERVIAD
jgi:hypothetical protein